MSGLMQGMIEPSWKQKQQQAIEDQSDSDDSSGDAAPDLPRHSQVHRFKTARHISVGATQGSTRVQNGLTRSRSSLWISPQSLSRCPRTLRGFTRALYSELGVPPRGDHLSSTVSYGECFF